MERKSHNFEAERHNFRRQSSKKAASSAKSSPDSESIKIDFKLRGKGFVTGANLAQHFNIRCCGCGKLYRVNSKEIFSSQPYFECQKCGTAFSFDYPFKDVNRIRTFEVSKLNKDADVVFADDFINICVQCGHENPLQTRDCRGCGVVLERSESQRQGALPSLVWAWHELLEDYNNIKKHLEFVNRCEDMQALPFALKKYTAMKEVQPHDNLTRDMLYGVHSKNLSFKKPNFFQKLIRKIQAYSPF